MPIKLFKCPLCGQERETLRPRIPKCNHNQEEEGIPTPLVDMESIMGSPNAKFMEPTNKEKGKSSMKGQQKILQERAKNHAREHDYHDLTQANSEGMAQRQGWIREDGTIKKKLDDV